MLVEQVIAWARSRGVKVLTLMVTSVNPTATKSMSSWDLCELGKRGPIPMMRR